MSCENNYLNQRGFTLIEISIVLVIIGLVVSGIIVGREMIANFELRAQVTDLEAINTSINTFKNKYNCLPGDCRTATRFFTASAQPEQVTNGNGDGKIAGVTGVAGQSVNWAGAASSEHMDVFDHLAAAGLYNMQQYDETGANTAEATTANRPGVGYPKLRIKSAGEYPLYVYWNNEPGGVIVGYEPGAGYISEGHKIRLGACALYPTHASYLWHNTGFTCGLNPWEAQSLDAKIDDGYPFSGTVVITHHQYIYNVPGMTWANSLANYCDAGNNDATLSASDNFYRSKQNIIISGGQEVNRVCTLSIKAAF